MKYKWIDWIGTISAGLFIGTTCFVGPVGAWVCAFGAYMCGLVVGRASEHENEKEKEFKSERIYNKQGEYLGNLDLPTAKHPIEIYYDYWHTKSEDK